MRPVGRTGDRQTRQCVLARKQAYSIRCENRQGSFVSARTVLIVSVIALAIPGCGTAPRPSPTEIRSGQGNEFRSGGALGSPGDRARIHTELGALYLQEGRYSIALDEARVAQVADPSFAPAYSLAGLVHMYLGDRSQAESSFSRALSIAPHDPDISNNYGWFLCQSGQEQQSFEYFQRAARNPLYKTPSKPRLNAGICYYRLGKLAEARASFDDAMRFAPGDPQVSFWLAQTSFRQGDLVQSRGHIADIEKRVELTAEALWLGLRVERGLGNREAEARFSSQLRRRFPTAPETTRLLKGDYE